MCAIERIAMEKTLPDRNSFRNSGSPWLRAVGLSFLFTLVLNGTALGQQVPVTGTVTSATGGPLRGVSVRVHGTDTRTVTDANGKYTVSAPADAVLTFSLIGRRLVQVGVLGR